MLALDPSRPVVSPLAAATLLVVRPAEGAGVEIFCVRRHAQSPFMGGAVVFPGGKLDRADADFGDALTRGLHPRAGELAANPGEALALTVCACREALEEATLLPTTPPLDDEALCHMRAALSSTPLAQLLRAHGARLATDGLVPFARWITPEAEPRRYDARFFLAAAGPGHLGHHDAHETTLGIWATPRRLLDAFFAGDLWLAPPTLRCLELLVDAVDLDAALSLGAAQSLLPICPTFVPGDPPMLVIPGDPEHAIAEPRVAGPTRFVLRGDRFLSER